MSELLPLLREIATDHAADDAGANERPASIETWWKHHRRLRDRFTVPFDRAVVGGLSADRLGYAFASGYREALVSLVPTLPDDAVAILSATEEQGVRPSNIRTTITPLEGGFVLSGKKRWGTLANVADIILVVAKEGADAAGRNRLRLVQIPARRAGVRMREMPPPPFAPEIPHAEIDFVDVRVADTEILPGDGWDQYLKPFRTVEDVHVHAALLGYVAGVAKRRAFPKEALEQIVSVIVTLRALALEPPSAPEVHVALAGAIAAASSALEGLEPLWASADDDERKRWVRDQGLLRVAGGARAQRREAAWHRLQSDPDLAGALPDTRSP
jgi:acyl-CoA dehydrogenase